MRYPRKQPYQCTIAVFAKKDGTVKNHCYNTQQELLEDTCKECHEHFKKNEVVRL